MGAFFNEKIRNLPTSEIRKLKSGTKVVINEVMGQTKGWAEDMRKAFNKPPIYISDKDKAKMENDGKPPVHD